MRADVKVGVVIAVCLALVFVVWYFAFYGGGETPDQPELTTSGLTDTFDDPNLIEAADPADPADTSDSDIIEVGYQEPSALGPAAETPAAVVPREEATSPPTVPGTGIVPVGYSDAASARLPDRSDEAALRLPVPGATGAAKPYVVLKGDTYWDIAAREYGRGGVFKTIQAANPTVPPTRLRPGMTITIPPKPEAVASAGSPRALADAGAIVTDVETGKKYYVVKKGDRGFWDIAKIAYRHGKFYTIVQAANPEFNPRSLKPGDKVWIPDRADEAVAAVAVSPRPSPAALAATGSVRILTGAPATAKLPGGRVFD